jgi:hypothetical protein
MLDSWALLGALYICVELCVSVAAGASLEDCRVAFKHWSLALGFDWWNGMKGLDDWLDELCVRSRELDAWIIGVCTSGYTLLPLIYLSI